MANIYNSGSYNKTTNELYVDIDFERLTERIFNEPPADPFTYRLEFLTELDENGLRKELGKMLMRGCKQKYNKEIAQLDEKEIEEMQKYYRSIGYEVDYAIGTQIRYVPELKKTVPELKKTVPVNLFQINFKPCYQALNKHNQPERFDQTTVYRC